MADITSNLKNITPTQWALIGGSGLVLGFLYLKRKKSTTAIPVDTSNLDTASSQGVAAYSGAPPTGGTGSLSFTPGGSSFPVTASGYTATELQDIIKTLIPQQTITTPTVTTNPPQVNPAAPPGTMANPTYVVPSPSPTPPPPAAPPTPQIPLIMNQSDYVATTGNAPALIDWIQKGGLIAGPNNQGYSSRTQIAADIQDRINRGYISGASGQSILAALNGYKGPA